MPEPLTPKQQQFNAAMERYEQQPVYAWVGKTVSWVVVLLQAVLAVLAFRHSIGWLAQLGTFLAAYILADFVNGWVHMFMDNNDAYESPAGPLIAAFHLHHRTPRYKENPLWVVYYHESGAKVWLAFFLVGAVLAAGTGGLGGVWVYGALYFAVLSSVAEVSHYLCHVPQIPAARFLAGLGLLLSKQHHMRHHAEDNVRYAFLNGMTDPVLDILAKMSYPGYKNTTDTHYARYQGSDTHNRA